ncbi:MULTISPECIES: SDR family NAD(P)-dependent oxidoreductase [unclassified Pseudomonas]|nr:MULTISPECIES: glucose 1-dehydrogenase [unclassified Pseudomonas]NWC96801.1 glucose 1-dehydrogenase [Pseudomonas sp. IPO3779]NWD21216.1 glucose 1-dehydrogenase [Pseudomonas sp. IPO3778]
MGRLENKVAVVTGASKGIGAAIATLFAAEGAAVVVNYASSKNDADKVVASITAAGGKAIAVKGDVSIAGQASTIIKAAVAEFGRLDILVNNAGIYEFAPLQEITPEHFHKSFNINVLGPLLMTQAAAKHLGEGGSVINIGSNITHMKPPGSAVYAASKSAIETIGGVLAKELGGQKIRVNTLNPGPTRTEGTRQIMTNNEMSQHIINNTPLGRMGLPEDIAVVALFLASDDSAWITGDVLLASGGL